MRRLSSAPTLFRQTMNTSPNSLTNNQLALLLLLLQCVDFTKAADVIDDANDIDEMGMLFGVIASMAGLVFLSYCLAAITQCCNERSRRRSQQAGEQATENTQLLYNANMVARDYTILDKDSDITIVIEPDNNNLLSNKP